jgi:Mg2+/Co2+ transporter CorB
MSAPLYGLEGGDQLIPVQVPEHLKKMCTTEFDSKRSLHNHLTGMFTTLAKELKTAIENNDKENAERLRKDQDELRTKIEQTWREMYMNEGAINVLNYLIDHENMKVEPLEMKSITQLQNVVLEQHEQMKSEGVKEKSGGICSYCGLEDGPVGADGNCAKCSQPILPKEAFESA